ncbi:autotransporter domain-containing protein [Sphingopyxis sp. LARHCG72]
MKFVKGLMVGATLMAGVSGQALAQGATEQPDARYTNADGSRTNDLEAAAKTWRDLPEFQADHAKQQIGAEYAYARGITGKGMKVGVVDEGVEPAHPTLATPGKVIYVDVTDAVLAGTQPRPGELFFDGTPIYRIGGTADHGTHVSGTIGAPRDDAGMMGVAHNAQIIAGTLRLGTDVLFLERILGSKPVADEDGPTIGKVIESGARVINNSWGGKLTEVAKKGDKQTIQTYYDTITLVPGDADLGRVRAALDKNRETLSALGLPAAKAGVVMVFAAGNDSGAHASPQASAPLLLPELESHWLSVVNLDTNGTELNQSSNVCGQTRAWCIAAPGTNIESAAMVRDMTPAAAEAAAALTPFESRDTYRAAVDALRASLAPPKLAYALANLVPAYEAQLDALRKNNPDPEALGKQWAAQLFDIAMKYQNAPNVLEAKAEGVDDMEIFMAVKGRFANLFMDDGLSFSLLNEYALAGVTDLAGKYDWEASPLYHMDLEYMRLATEATELQLTEGLKSGTSMAAPHVSGALALVMERFPYMSEDLARDTVLTTATDIGAAGVDGFFGWGRLDIGKAMAGPAAFLRDNDVTLGAGVSDAWDNDIADGSEYLGDGYGGGLTLRGEGTLTLGGNNSYLGDTNVIGGTLLVNGTQHNSDAFVFDGATIGGNGTLKSLVVDSGGTVSPGNSIDTLKVAGDLLFKPGSVYLVESAVNAAAIDRIDVGGTATIEGGTVKLQADTGDWNLRSRADILTAGGGVTGAFDTIESNLAFLDTLLSYGPNSVTLTLERNDVTFASVGRTPNQRAAGSGLDGLAPEGLLYDALVDGSAGAVTASLDGFSGETHASLAAVAVTDTGYIRDAMLRRMPHSLTAVGAGEAENRTSTGVVAWGQALAGFSERDGSPGIAAVKTDSKGFITGIDKSWDDRFNLGVAFGYVDSDVNVRRPGSNNNDVESWHVGGYVGAEFGPARVRAGGSWGSYTTRMSRTASVNAFSDSLSDRYEGRAWQAFGEFGLGFEAGPLSFEPFANLTHVDYRGKRIDEQGGPARLEGRATQKVTTTTLGLRSAAKLLESAEGRSGFARVNVGWRHDIDNGGARADLAFAGSSTAFIVAGAEPGKDVALVDLALDLPMSKNLDIGVTYGGQFAELYTAHAVKATLQLRF